MKVKVDLHARLPSDEELEHAKYDPPRVGRARAGGELHAYGTPEAFAIDEDVQEIPLEGRTLMGPRFAASSASLTRSPRSA